MPVNMPRVFALVLLICVCVFSEVAQGCTTVETEEELLTTSFDGSKTISLCLEGPLERTWVLSEYPDIIPLRIPSGHKLSIDCGGRGLWTFDGFFISSNAELELVNCAVFALEDGDEIGNFVPGESKIADYGGQEGSTLRYIDSSSFSPIQFKDFLTMPEFRASSYVQQPGWPLELGPAVEDGAYWAITVVRGIYGAGPNQITIYDATNFTIWSGPEWSSKPSIVAESVMVAGVPMGGGGYGESD